MTFGAWVSWCQIFCDDAGLNFLRSRRNDHKNRFNSHYFSIGIRSRVSPRSRMISVEFAILSRIMTSIQTGQNSSGLRMTFLTNDLPTQTCSRRRLATSTNAQYVSILQVVVVPASDLEKPLLMGGEATDSTTNTTSPLHPTEPTHHHCQHKF